MLPARGEDRNLHYQPLRPYKGNVILLDRGEDRALHKQPR